MRTGYARCSTHEQNLDAQLDALRALGCDRFFEDVGPCTKDRPNLKRMLETMRSGDEVVVWRLDRLGRSLTHLVDIIERFKAAKVTLIVEQSGIDTSTTGRAFFGLFTVLAEFEREIIRERTLAGLAGVRARGSTGGRPRVMTTAKLLEVQEHMKNRTISITEITRLTGVSRSTLYRYLTARGVFKRPAHDLIEGA